MSQRITLHKRQYIRNQADILRTTESSKPCVNRKATLTECVRYEINFEKAEVMNPEDLTQEELFFLLNQGIPIETIWKAYQMA